MVKKIDINQTQISGTIGTANKWYKGANIELVNNTGQTDIRIDKVMVQVGHYNTMAAGPGVLGCLVHMTDETGADLSSSITAGTTDDAALEVLLNQWKDNVFMTDFRIVQSGFTTNLPVVALEADTRRILKPGQKMYVIVLFEPLNAETTKSSISFIDSMVWYSAAAQ